MKRSDTSVIALSLQRLKLLNYICHKRLPVQKVGVQVQKVLLRTQLSQSLAGAMCPLRLLQEASSHHVTALYELGAKTLLGAPGLTTRNKKLLGAPGRTTRSILDHSCY